MRSGSNIDNKGISLPDRIFFKYRDLQCRPKIGNQATKTGRKDGRGIHQVFIFTLIDFKCTCECSIAIGIPFKIGKSIIAIRIGRNTLPKGLTAEDLVRRMTGRIIRIPAWCRVVVRDGPCEVVQITSLG